MKLFKNLLVRWKNRHAEEQFRRGYDFAAGCLLRGDMDAGELLDLYTSMGSVDPFDSGIRSAVDDWALTVGGGGSVLNRGSCQCQVRFLEIFLKSENIS